MTKTALHFPDDPAQLQALLQASQVALATSEAENEKLRGQLSHREAELEKLKFELARLKRMRFGRASEKLDGQIAQLELLIEEHETPAEVSAPAVDTPPAQRRRPVRKPMPAHLPREAIVHEAGCVCPGCGGALRSIGEDVSEVLEYIPKHWKVIRHVRPKQACGHCDTVVQAPAVSRPIVNRYAGPGLLSHVLVSKYCDHLPLHRQSRIYARDGVELDVSTLADWAD